MRQTLLSGFEVLTGWVGGWLGGWVGVQADGWRDGQMDGWRDDAEVVVRGRVLQLLPHVIVGGSVPPLQLHKTDLE